LPCCSERPCGNLEIAYRLQPHNYQKGGRFRFGNLLRRSFPNRDAELQRTFGVFLVEVLGPEKNWFPGFSFEENGLRPEQTAGYLS